MAGRSCRSMVDRKITGLEVAGSSPVTITFYHACLIYLCYIQFVFFKREVNLNKAGINPFFISADKY